MMRRLETAVEIAFVGTVLICAVVVAALIGPLVVESLIRDVRWLLT